MPRLTRHIIRSNRITIACIAVSILILVALGIWLADLRASSAPAGQRTFGIYVDTSGPLQVSHAYTSESMSITTRTQYFAHGHPYAVSAPLYVFTTDMFLTRKGLSQSQFPAQLAALLGLDPSETSAFIRHCGANGLSPFTIGDYFGIKRRVDGLYRGLWLVRALLIALLLRLAFVSAKSLRRFKRCECVACGYSLVGLERNAETRCPECGHRLET